MKSQSSYKMLIIKTKLNTMAERYQWTQGPYNGQIETVNCEDDNYVYFDSGRRCSKQKMGFMMFQTSDSEETNFFGNSLNTFEDEINMGIGHDYSGDLNLKVDIPEEFKDEVVKAEVQQTVKPTQTFETPAVETITLPVSVAVKEESPVVKLLKMQKEESLITTAEPIHISLKWPTKQFIEILLNTFDKELVINELYDYMIDQITVENLKRNVESSIMNGIEQLCNINIK